MSQNARFSHLLRLSRIRRRSSARDNDIALTCLLSMASLISVPNGLTRKKFDKRMHAAAIHRSRMLK
jgi:hypothetical protein